tara:strand:- start:4446 stop:4697 length:252 start_codon:yes stop_codon:yes gene_type:complete
MKISKDNAYIILTPNTPDEGDVGLQMINYTDDPNVDTLSYGIKWLVTQNPELVYYIGAREMEYQLIKSLKNEKEEPNEDPSLH